MGTKSQPRPIVETQGDSCCCFSIPQGGKAVAIIECVILTIAAFGAITSFFFGQIIHAAITLVVSIGILICAVFFYRGVELQRPSYILPYAIVKTIQLVLQGLTIIMMIVSIAGWASLQGRTDIDEDAIKTSLIICTVVLVVCALYFGIGIVFVDVAFKSRKYLLEQLKKDDGAFVISPQGPNA